LPATGWRVDGQGIAFGENRSVGGDGDVFWEEDVVVGPGGVVVDPEMPAVVGNEGAVFGVGDGCSSGFGGDGCGDLGGSRGDGGGLEKTAAGKLAHEGSLTQGG